MAKQAGRASVHDYDESAPAPDTSAPTEPARAETPAPIDAPPPIAASNSVADAAATAAALARGPEPPKSVGACPMKACDGVLVPLGQWRNGGPWFHCLACGYGEVRHD